MALGAVRLDGSSLFHEVIVSALPAVGLCATIALGLFLTSAAPPIFALGGAAALIILLLAARAPRAVVLGTLLFLPFAGILRRATNSYTTSLDPLAVIGPILAGGCLFVLAQSRPRRHSTALTGAVSAMAGLGLLEIVNPLQGGLGVGVVGAGLFVGPMVWFFVGQRIGDEATLQMVTRALLVIVALAAVYGVKQTIFGFTGFEDRWVAARISSYAALDIGGKIRPFSTFSSGAEYSYFLVLGAVLLAAGQERRGRYLRRAGIVALLVACFYAGTRSIFVTGVLSVITAGLVHRINHLGRALMLCAGIGVLGLALLQFVPLSSDDSTAGEIRNRTLIGLARPFDREVSTLGLHLDSFGRGIQDGLRHPVGRGAGAVNSAGLKLGTGSISSEHDVPNVLIAYGWTGALLLIPLLSHIYRLIRTCVQERRHDLIGPAMFVLALFGAWFVGELYAASALVWFFVGSLDRIVDESRDVSVARRS